jgi:hypothetical protein
MPPPNGNLNEIIDAVAIAYSVDRKVIEDCLNLTLLRKRAKAFPTAEYVEWNPELGVILFGNHGCKPLAGVGRGIKRMLLYDLEYNLITNTVIRKDLDVVKPYMGTAGSVRIERILENGDLMAVLLDLGVFGQEIEISRGVVKRSDQSPYEINNHLYQPGRIMWVLVKNIEIIDNQGLPAVRPLFSRSSKALPALLLKKHAPDAQIVCTTRITGRRCDILSNKRLSIESIKAVNKELNERIHVKYN